MPSASDSNSGASLIARLAATQSRIAAAALRYRRAAGSVMLLAVSKQQSVNAIRMLAAAGQRDFGENYLQEALPKIDALANLNLTWHYIGQIQSNKTRAIAEQFAWAHTVDRAKIADRLSDQRPPQQPPLNVCIEVKLASEATKGGAEPSDVPNLARHIASLPNLKLRGLMCIPPPRETFDEQLSFFERTASLLAELNQQGLALDTLSMGMSADLEAAIAAGATIVRVGTGIFGERSK